MEKLFYIDVETTGTDPSKHGLVQIAGIVEIDGEVKEKINLFIAPFEDDVIEQEALEVIGKTKAELMGYSSPRSIYQELVRGMEKYVDRYNREDKFHFVGYNSRFDDSFIRAWFKKLNDKYYGSWFHWPAIDVSNLAAIHFLNNGGRPTNFKLMTVANELGIAVDTDQAHDALYDVRITRKIFKSLI